MTRQIHWNWNPKRWAWQTYESYGGHLKMRWFGPLLISWMWLDGLSEGITNG